jgi:predicted DNA-binding helix-hairpin-helix protein
MLLRIPGLGVRNVDRLIQLRRWHRVTLPDLTRLRVPMTKILPFITTSDHHPAQVGGRVWRAALPSVRQMDLFAPQPSVFATQL